jgi:hypothetical protein
VFDTPYVLPRQQQKWASSLKKPFNFFKHGRNEPGDAVIEFDTVWTEVMLTACCKGLSNMGLPLEGEWLALTYWLLFANPRALNGNKHLLQYPQVQFIQQLTTKGRDVYFREFMAAFRADKLRFTDTRDSVGSVK